jgi:uncharacterized protein (TIGR02145 family)
MRNKPINKSKGFFATTLAASIALVLALTGCDGGKSALVGHWVHESGAAEGKPENMELFNDGTGVCDGLNISWKVENKRFVLLSSSKEFASDYEVSGYRLTFTDNVGKNTYINISNKNYLKKGSLTDSRDGNIYSTTKIGEQVWMAENLNYEIEGGKCYKGDIANCAKYGRLYNWEAAMKACPSGWHLPSYEEWQTFVDFFGGDKVAGKKLKAANGWNSDDEKSGNGTDIYGFSALPSGYGNSGGIFYFIGNYGSWWSSSEIKDDSAYYRDMDYNLDGVGWNYYIKSYFFSVRCLQN